MMTSREFRDALKSLGLSQRDLAERLGLSQSTVSNWATEKAPVPQYAVAYLEQRRELDNLKAKFRAAMNL